MLTYNTPPVSEKAISLPFSITPYGTIASTTDPYKLWADRARSVIGTAIGERIYRSKFGTSIPQGIFDTTEEYRVEIETQIRSAFSSFLPTLSLEDIVIANFSQDTNDNEENGLYVEVTYSLPNGKIETIIIGVATINGNSPIIEENAWQLQ
jgi:phage baseplate assembly protein W